jgi:uncharacterized membrane protein
MLGGLLPAPELLREYEEQHAGAAAWILAEAEKTTEHMRAMQQLALAIGARDALLSRLLPFLMVMALIVASVLIAIFASTWLGGATFAASLGAVMLEYLRRDPRR